MQSFLLSSNFSQDYYNNNGNLNDDQRLFQAQSYQNIQNNNDYYNNQNINNLYVNTDYSNNKKDDDFQQNFANFRISDNKETEKNAEPKTVEKVPTLS